MQMFSLGSTLATHEFQLQHLSILIFFLDSKLPIALQLEWVSFMDLKTLY